MSSNLKRWHLNFNYDNDRDKVILDYFYNLDTSLTTTALVKEFLYNEINKKNKMESENNIINGKLDYIISTLKNIQTKNDSQENRNSQYNNLNKKTNLFDQISEFENSI